MPLPLSETRPVLTLGLRGSGIRTVLWATGYRPHHPWLHVPVLDAAGRVLHAAGSRPPQACTWSGSTGRPRRSSSFLAGMGEDAQHVVGELVRRLTGPRRLATPTPPPRPTESIA